MASSRQLPSAGEVVRLSARVRRITQDNPSIFTGVGTNTHLVGEREIFILDPEPHRTLTHLFLDCLHELDQGK